MPRNRRDAGGPEGAAPDHAARSRAHCSTSDAQVPASDCRATVTSTEGVFSTARRNRNHDVSEIRRAEAGGVSPRSRMASPNPPPWISKSAAFKACSVLWPHRTHSRRFSSTPAAAAEAGSKASSASTSAQVSCRAVAAARIDSNRLVRPDEAGPTISVRQPRGRSISAIPLGTVSGSGRARQSSGPPRKESNCSRRAAAPIFAFYSPILYLYRKAGGGVNGWRR